MDTFSAEPTYYDTANDIFCFLYGTEFITVSVCAKLGLERTLHLRCNDSMAEDWNQSAWTMNIQVPYYRAVFQGHLAIQHSDNSGHKFYTQFGDVSTKLFDSQTRSSWGESAYVLLEWFCYARSSLVIISFVAYGMRPHRTLFTKNGLLLTCDAYLRDSLLRQDGLSGFHSSGLEYYFLQCQYEYVRCIIATKISVILCYGSIASKPLASSFLPIFMH